MKRLVRIVKRLVRIVLPLLILSAGAAGFYYLRSRPKLQARAAVVPIVPLVETVVVIAHDDGLEIQTDGVVVPFREVALSSEVEGRITFKDKTCRAGSYVSAGTLLFQIDPRDYELEVRRLKKQLFQAEASLRELDVEALNTSALAKLAEEELALQRKELARSQNLGNRHVTTDSEVDAAKRDELSARNSLLALTNQLRLQTARRERLTGARDLVSTQLEKAGLSLTRTKVVAPISGVVTEDFVEQDSYVQQGTSLIRINDSSAAEVKCKLKMEELYWIWDQDTGGGSARREEFSGKSAFEVPETPATVVYRLLGHEFTWAGTLSRYEGRGLDLATRTVPCRVLVNDPRDVRVTGVSGQGVVYTGPRALVTGMFVAVRVHTRPTTHLLSVPERAVRPGRRIWVVRDGKLTIQKVQPVETIQGDVILAAATSSISVGDHVVVSTLPAAEQGMSVREEEVGGQR